MDTFLPKANTQSTTAFGFPFEGSCGFSDVNQFNFLLFLSHTIQKVISYFMVNLLQLFTILLCYDKLPP